MAKSIETTFGRFIIRPYRNEDEKGVMALWETVFRKPMDVRVWRWKYHDNPFGRQMMVCVNHLNMPVALFSGIPFHSQCNGNTINMVQMTDNMSHPEYRQPVHGRKGLFVETARFFFEVFGDTNSTNYHYGLPGVKHFRLGELLLGYRALDHGICYLEAETGNLRRPGLLRFRKMDEPNTFDDRFDAFWNKTKDQFPMAINRNSTFLNWRFSKHPTNTYETYAQYSRHGELQSFLVTLQQGNTSTLVDMIAGKKDLASFQWLISRVMHQLAARGVSRIQTWVTEDHFLIKPLINQGFFKKPEPLGVIPAKRILATNHHFYGAEEHLFYTMADGDLF